jgi:hypothetical protein
MVILTLQSDETWIRVKLVNTTLRQLLNYGYVNVTAHLIHEHITGSNRHCTHITQKH